MKPEPALSEANVWQPPSGSFNSQCYTAFMPGDISKELFDHLVELAALELKPEEAEYIHKELNRQLKVIEELAAIPIDESAPTASHGVSYGLDIRPPLRPDQVSPSGISKEILEQTPETEAGYIVVPEIPHESLE